MFKQVSKGYLLTFIAVGQVLMAVIVIVILLIITERKTERIDELEYSIGMVNNRLKKFMTKMDVELDELHFLINKDN